MPDFKANVTRIVDQPAIDNLGGKAVLPTIGDIGFRNELHKKAFVIAGVTNEALLKDVQNLLTKAMEKGIPLEQFQREFKKTIDGRWLPTSKTGIPNTGWRARLIYHTNIRAEYDKSHREQLKRIVDTHPYWRWRIGFSKVHREDHVARDGMCLKWDDPWWNDHPIPDGHGCNCRIEALCREEMKELGKVDENGNIVPDIPPPDRVRKTKPDDTAIPLQPSQMQTVPPSDDTLPSASPTESLQPPKNQGEDVIAGNSGEKPHTVYGTNEPRPTFSDAKGYMAWLLRDSNAVDAARKLSNCEATIHVSNILEGYNKFADEINRAAKKVGIPNRVKRMLNPLPEWDFAAGHYYRIEPWMAELGFKPRIILDKEFIEDGMNGRIRFSDIAGEYLLHNGYDHIKGITPDQCVLWIISHEIAHAAYPIGHTEEHYVMMKNIMDILCPGATKLPFKLIVKFD